MAVKPDKSYLDIGCGTGNYTIALANKGADLTGVEPSASMLDIARKHKGNLKWLQGYAEQIPADDNSFDGVIATLTIHHWRNLNLALKEINRVIKPGGTVVFFTATPLQMQGYWLNYYFPEMMKASILQMPSLAAIESLLDNNEFTDTATEKYFIQDDLQDCFLYAGKNKPQMYLDDDVRKGISSFAAIANADEVDSGLLKLSADIESGAFNPVKDSYKNDNGDYLFISAKKIEPNSQYK